MNTSLRKTIETFVLTSFLTLIIFLAGFFFFVISNEKKVEKERAKFFLDYLAEGQLPYFVSELDNLNIEALRIRAQIIQATHRGQNLSIIVTNSKNNVLVGDTSADELLPDFSGNDTVFLNHRLFIKKNMQIGNDHLGDLVLSVIPNSQSSLLLKKSFTWSIAILFILMILITLALRYYLRKIILNPITSLLSKVMQIDYFVSNKLTNSPFDKSVSQLEEFVALESTLNKISIELKTSVKDKLKFEKHATEIQTLAAISKQVSHDIRSPLSALSTILSTISEIPEEKRIVVRHAVNRINDIANQLLEQSKHADSKKSADQFPNDSFLKENQISKNIVQTVFLPELVDSIVSEKRIQYRDRLGIDIEAHLISAYGYFVLAVGREIKRVLSNLINNSIEAFSNAKGSVTISLEGTTEYILIRLIDNGKGIPETILEKIGRQGFSFGKEGTNSGTGLGVFHAKTTIESFGGKFEIDSKENYGTIITIKLPRAKPPIWFVEKLIFQRNSLLIVLDDDTSIHGLWRDRLQSIRADEYGVKMASFSTGHDLIEWMRENKAETNSNMLFLVDYELLGQKRNGLDIIEELNIEKQSILVTSRYDEKSIMDRCSKLLVRQIPKSMAGFVPIGTGLE